MHRFARAGAARAGATKQEAAEVIGVSIMMHGGPATIYRAVLTPPFASSSMAAKVGRRDGE